MVTNQQVRRLISLMKSEKTKAMAAAKAGMDVKTARKYVQPGKLPNESRNNHDWRTRQDPFDSDWEQIKELLGRKSRTGS